MFSVQRRRVFLSTAYHQVFPFNTYYARKPSSRRFLDRKKSGGHQNFLHFSPCCLHESERRDVPMAHSPRQCFSITCKSCRSLTLLPCGRKPRKFTPG